MSAFFWQKISVFCSKKYLYSKQQCESCVRDFLVLFSVFVRPTVTFTENITFGDSVPGIRSPDCSKLAKNPKNVNNITIFRHDINFKIFWRCFVSLVKFSYLSKFHVNIISGSGITTIFFYKGLTRNLQIRNTPAWVLPNIWRLGQVMDTKVDTNVSSRMLLNATKFQGYSFYHFWVIKKNPTAGVKFAPPPLPPRLGLICNIYYYIY